MDVTLKHLASGRTFTMSEESAEIVLTNEYLKGKYIIVTTPPGELPTFIFVNNTSGNMKVEYRNEDGSSLLGTATVAGGAKLVKKAADMPANTWNVSLYAPVERLNFRKGIFLGSATNYQYSDIPSYTDYTPGDSLFANFPIYNRNNEDVVTTSLFGDALAVVDPIAPSFVFFNKTDATMTLSFRNNQGNQIGTQLIPSSDAGIELDKSSLPNGTTTIRALAPKSSLSYSNVTKDASGITENYAAVESGLSPTDSIAVISVETSFLTVLVVKEFQF